MEAHLPYRTADEPVAVTEPPSRCAAGEVWSFEPMRDGMRDSNMCVRPLDLRNLLKGEIV